MNIELCRAYVELLQKASENDQDLPGGEWYKALLPSLAYQQAGRAEALAAAYPNLIKSAPWSIRHPYWQTLFAMLAGIPIGAVAGAGVDSVLGNTSLNAPGRWGTLFGATMGAGLAGVLAGLYRQGKVREISKAVKNKAVNKKQVRQLLQEQADQGAIGSTLMGAFTGPADIGYTDQLINLLKGFPVRSGETAGALHAGPLATQMYMGNKARDLSRQALKIKEAADQSTPTQVNSASEVKSKQRMLCLLLGLESVPAAIKAEAGVLQGAKKCEPGCKHDGSCPGCRK